VNHDQGADGVASRPYVGLRAFRSDEQALFFGRGTESIDIARLWRANKVTLLYGASGVGKTSLLQAGIIPALDRERFDVLPVGRIRPEMIYPGTALSFENPYTLALMSSWAPDVDVHSLREMTILSFLRSQKSSPDRYGDPKPVLVAIDQFEEVFSGPVQWQGFMQPFMAELTDALREHRDLRLLLSLREDYLAPFLPYEHLLAGQAHARSRLLPLGKRAALEAIRGPLSGTGRTFDQHAAEELVEDLRTVKFTNALGEERTVMAESVEPVQVQVVCSALWDSLPPGTTVITSAHVREHADVDRFLASFCSRTLSLVAREHGLAAARIRSWLQRTFVTELGTRGTAYEGIDQTAGMPNAVVASLEDRHIIRAEIRSGTRWYELQHDRLIEPIRQGDPQEHIEAAKLARDDADWDVVEHHAMQAVRVFGADELQVRAEAEQLLGEVAQARGQTDDALDHYRAAATMFEVLQDSAKVGALLAAAGRLGLASGRYASALGELRAAITRIPGDPEVQTNLARAMWHTGQPMAAVAVLNNVLSEDGNLITALTARGEILADLGQADDALRDLDRVRHHQEASTLAARALALAQVGRFEAAHEEIADALANGVSNGLVHLRAARICALSGDRNEVVRLAAAALAATNPILPPHLREFAQRLLEDPGLAA
jgi:hypothetical protein